MTMMVMDGDVVGGNGEDVVARDGEDDGEGGGGRNEGDVAAVVGGDVREFRVRVPDGGG